ncbi:MAG: RNA polymerase sigma factor [Lachnospiraceae bacterium]|nr:RNA polymerase sigma factor [Lachnospiraceae bacterium]
MEIKFEDMYQRFFKDVYLFVFSISKDRQIAEDITQETFFKALKEIKNFRGDCSVKSWLCQIAKNLYISQMRKKSMISFEDMDAVPNQISSTNIEQEYIQKEDKLSVYKVLHFLDEPYKEIFLLRTLGDLSFKEIADVFHKTESWARVTYHRARLKIQEALEQK